MRLSRETMKPALKYLSFPVIAMKIKNEIHNEYPWIARRIAKDFELWDVWEFPIRADNSETQDFNSFCEVYKNSFSEMSGLTGMLFKLRFWLGKVLGLDKNKNMLPISGCEETSVRSRLSGEDEERNRIPEDVPGAGLSLFRAVYLFDNERLDELSNNTVHALMHTGWVEKQENHYTAQLAVYVKPRGRAGHVYLKLIEPFRRHIVYPAMMKKVKAQWEEHCRT